MNLYKKPLSSSQYCHTEEEAVTNIHKVFYQKRLYLIYLKAFLIRAAVSARSPAPARSGPHRLSPGMEGSRQARHRLSWAQDCHLRQRLLLAPLPQVQP